MKTSNLLQSGIVLLLGGIFYMLIVINKRIPEFKVVTRSEYEEIRELDDEDLRKARLDSLSVFIIDGDVDAHVYNTVDVEIKNQ